MITQNAKSNTRSKLILDQILNPDTSYPPPNAEYIFNQDSRVSRPISPQTQSNKTTQDQTTKLKIPKPPAPPHKIQQIPKIRPQRNQLSKTIITPLDPIQSLTSAARYSSTAAR
ncbi:hypothetical protein Drorol1_Dr00026106 [Drosera rotundifolia]